jgi:hypothetical protein
MFTATFIKMLAKYVYRHFYLNAVGYVSRHFYLNAVEYVSRHFLFECL